MKAKLPLLHTATNLKMKLMACSGNTRKTYTVKKCYMVLKKTLVNAPAVSVPGDADEPINMSFLMFHSTSLPT